MFKTLALTSVGIQASGYMVGCRSIPEECPLISSCYDDGPAQCYVPDEEWQGQLCTMDTPCIGAYDGDCPSVDSPFKIISMLYGEVYVMVEGTTGGDAPDTILYYSSQCKAGGMRGTSSSVGTRNVKEDCVTNSEVLTCGSGKQFTGIVSDFASHCGQDVHVYTVTETEGVASLDLDMRTVTHYRSTPTGEQLAVVVDDSDDCENQSAHAIVAWGIPTTSTGPGPAPSSTTSSTSGPEDGSTTTTESSSTTEMAIQVQCLQEEDLEEVWGLDTCPGYNTTSSTTPKPGAKAVAIVGTKGGNTGDWPVCGDCGVVELSDGTKVDVEFSMTMDDYGIKLVMDYCPFGFHYLVSIHSCSGSAAVVLSLIVTIVSLI